MWYNYIAVCLTDVSILLSDPWCLKIVFLGDNLMVAAILSDLFNKSLITGTLPTAWKFARVVPIPKSGSSKDSANYRPISILTVISKLLEKHIHNLLLLHLNSVSPLSQHQWGFTAGRSPTTALLSFTHNCQAALDSGDEVCSVFFDLCKAFDKVPHLPLLQKLADLQVNPCILRWIGSYLYLTDRKLLFLGESNQVLCMSYLVSPKALYLGLCSS